MRVTHLRSTVLVAAVAVGLVAGVGCGGSAARGQADVTTTSTATSTTIDDARVCAQKFKKFENEYATLDDYRVQVEQAEKTLNAQLNAAAANNSPDVGNLEAEHNAVIQQLSDIQLRILELDNRKPDSHFCGSEICSGSDGMSSTTVCKPNP